MTKIRLVSLIIITLFYSCEKKGNGNTKSETQTTINKPDSAVAGNIAEHKINIPEAPEFNNENVINFINRVNSFCEKIIATKGNSEEIMKIQQNESLKLSNEYDKIIDSLPEDQAKLIEKWYNDVMDNL